MENIVKKMHANVTLYERDDELFLMVQVFLSVGLIDILLAFECVVVNRWRLIGSNICNICVELVTVPQINIIYSHNRVQIYLARLSKCNEIARTILLAKSKKIN